MELLRKNLSIQIFHADFEKAAHIAVLQSFPQFKKTKLYKKNIF